MFPDTAFRYPKVPTYTVSRHNYFPTLVITCSVQYTLHQ